MKGRDPSPPFCVTYKTEWVSIRGGQRTRSPQQQGGAAARAPTSEGVRGGSLVWAPPGVPTTGDSAPLSSPGCCWRFLRQLLFSVTSLTLHWNFTSNIITYYVAIHLSFSDQFSLSVLHFWQVSQGFNTGRQAGNTTRHFSGGWCTLISRWQSVRGVGVSPSPRRSHHSRGSLWTDDPTATLVLPVITHNQHTY